jgi:hypothetical protein
MSFVEVSKPRTEHSDLILVGAWPSQSAVAWGGFHMELRARARLMAAQYDTQFEIRNGLRQMSGSFIDDAGIPVASKRETTLVERIQTYNTCADAAESVWFRINATKEDLCGVVRRAEDAIEDERAKAEKAKADVRAKATVLTAAAAEAECRAIDAKLKIAEKTIVNVAHASAMESATTSAVTAREYADPVKGLKLSYPVNNGAGPSTSATPMPTGIGGAPTAPAPGIQPVDYSTFKDAPASAESGDRASDALTPASNGTNKSVVNAGDDRPSPEVKPTAATSPNGNAAPSPGASAHGSSVPPPVASAPSPGGSSMGGMGSGPSSVLGSMMQPMQGMSSAGSSPASSSPGAAGGMPGAGAPAPGGAQAAGAPLTGAGGGGAAGVGGGASAAGLGSGIAESSAMMGTGAVSATANVLGGAGNVGFQVAQGTAAAAAQAAPLAASGAPVSTATGGPVAMMPPPAAAVSPVVEGPVGGGSAVVSGAPNVGSGTPGTPPPGAASGGASVGAGGGGAGATLVPVQPVPSMRSVGAGGATGDELYRQAADAARTAVTVLVAQSLESGLVDLNRWGVAVSVIAERSGLFTAWMATSMGPSYIHLGVRVPEGIGLAVADEVVGGRLVDLAADRGGADPLEVVVRHAEMREAVCPGGRVLAVASSLPEGRVVDWAAVVGARPVHVNPKLVERARAGDIDIGGVLLHRCAVAMPWDWRQANAFDEEGRLRVASRHMHMARLAGHLTGRACLRVIDKFERCQLVTDDDWADVEQEHANAFVEYSLAADRVDTGGGAGNPDREFRTFCAAEVVRALRHCDTADGCADLLYAARLAGAPLNPAAAVA